MPAYNRSLTLWEKIPKAKWESFTRRIPICVFWVIENEMIYFSGNGIKRKSWGRVSIRANFAWKALIINCVERCFSPGQSETPPWVKWPIGKTVREKKLAINKPLCRTESTLIWMLGLYKQPRIAAGRNIPTLSNILPRTLMDFAV